MKTLVLILAYIIAAINIYAQSTSTYNNTVYQNIKVGNKVYLKKNNSWRLINKALRDKYDKQYKNAYKGLDEYRVSEAMRNIRILNSNDSIVEAVKSIFSPTEIEELKDEKLSITFRIDKHGKIIYMAFNARSDKLKNLNLSKYSLLEDKLISTMRFKVPDPDIKVYTISLPFIFKGLYDDTYVFPQKLYANPE